MRCPACGALASEPVFAAEAVPVLCNVLCPTAAQARAVPRGQVELRCCGGGGGCGLVFNGAFEAALVEYRGAYENALHYSGTFREYAAGLARELAERYGLGGKTVVEVGCGDGYFLRLLCAAAGRGTVGLGFDPAYHEGRAAGAPAVESGGAEVRVTAGVFEKGAARPDLLVCRHVLEHIARPVEFLRGLRGGMPQGAAAYIEVPNGEWVARAGSGWDVIYEHVNYFTARALKNVCAAAGLRAVRLRERYGGQFLSVEAIAENEGPAESGDGAAERDLWERFGRAHAAAIGEWNRRLEEWSDRGLVAAVWGAGSKGVMFLNSVRLAAERVERAVDVSPRKDGMYIVGTGTPIVRPAGLVGTETRVVILANPMYRDEVAAELAGLGLGGVELAAL